MVRRQLLFREGTLERMPPLQRTLAACLADYGNEPYLPLSAPLTFDNGTTVTGRSPLLSVVMTIKNIRRRCFVLPRRVR